MKGTPFVYGHLLGQKAGMIRGDSKTRRAGRPEPTVMANVHAEAGGRLLGHEAAVFGVGIAYGK